MVKASLNEVRSIDFIEESHLHTSTHRYETVNRVDVLKLRSSLELRTTSALYMNASL